MTVSNDSVKPLKPLQDGFLRKAKKFNASGGCQTRRSALS